MTTWIGVAFLVACGLGVPLYRKAVHATMLRALGLEGVTVVPRLLGLSGLRLRRARWEGDVRFESPTLGGGGHRGHVLLSVPLGRPQPLVTLEQAGAVPSADAPTLPTGDAAFDVAFRVRGDAALSKRIFDDAQRGRLLRLRESGAAFGLAIAEGQVRVTRPLPADADDLKRFLSTIDPIVDGIVGATA